MFPRPGKSGKCKRGGLHDARSISPTIASTESPEILCNPFCLPSPAPAHQNDSDDSCLDVAKHLICELPNIYLIPPNGDPLKTSICVWNSKFDGILSSFLDSDPSTPLATPRSEWPTLDWIALASAYKKIEDGQKDLPTFCRPSAGDIQSRSVIMPRASIGPSKEVIAFPAENDAHRSPVVSQLAAYQFTSADESNTSSGPQHSRGPKTDKGHCETQGQSVEAVRPASPPARLSGIRAGMGIGWPSGFTERSSSDGVDPHLDPPGRDTIKTGILPTSEKLPSVAVTRTVSSQSNGPLTAPISLNPTDVAVSATHVAADVAINWQTHARVNASLADQQGLAPPLSGVTACLNINKALPSIPFQLPQLPFVVEPVVFGPLGWIMNSDSLAFMSGGDAPSDSGGAKSSQIFGLSAAISPPKRVQNSIVTDKALQPSLIPDDDSDSDATTASSLTRVNACLSEEDQDTSLSSGLLTSLEEVASVVRSLNLPKPWPSMRLLPPTSPSLPPLDFDPYGFAGGFKTYLHLKTSRD